MSSHYDQAVEVFEAEIAGIRQTLDALRPDFDRAVEIILATPGKVVVTGLGKSGIIGHKISATLASTGTPSVFINASEALHGDLGMVSAGDTAVMISNSGSTTELLRMLPSLRKAGVSLIGILGNRQTKLAEECAVLLDASVAKEACPLNLTPMTSSTVALVIGDALAAALMRARQFTPEHFAANHPAGALGRNLLLKVADVMHTGGRLATVAPEAAFREVIIELTRTNLGGVCVTDPAGRLLGFVSEGDVRRALLDDHPMEQSARDLMTPSPVTCSPEHSLGEVLTRMEDPARQIYTMPVTADGGRCVGMIRMHDILQANT
ncbi:MAG: KpsF/GutQ family sugar-phosphate isomerase [Verrucomicrobiota bacterium]